MWGRGRHVLSMSSRLPAGHTGWVPLHQITGGKRDVAIARTLSNGTFWLQRMSSTWRYSSLALCSCRLVAAQFL